jgi:hypothetical protein
MKPYKMPAKDMLKGICWKYAIACILEISPKKVPNFVTKKSMDDVERTRKWLIEKHKKSIVWMPMHLFLESACRNRENPRGGPDGYSIIIIDTVNDDSTHAAIAKDGKLCFNPCDNEYTEFKHPIGFYIIHDL